MVHQQGLSRNNPAGALLPVTVNPKTIQDRPITGLQGIPGRSIPIPGQGMITKTVKPKNRTTRVTMIPVQIALCVPDQEVTTAEAVTTGGFKRGAISRRREANHRLLPTASTTATIHGVDQAHLTRAAVPPDQEAVEAVVQAVEVPSAAEGDNLASASSYPNNHSRVCLFRETRIFKTPQQ